MIAGPDPLAPTQPGLRDLWIMMVIWTVFCALVVMADSLPWRLGLIPLMWGAGLWLLMMARGRAAAGNRQLEALTDEISFQRDHLQMIIDGARLGTWDWDIPSGHVRFNERWAEMLGYDPEEIQPDLSTWTRVVHPDEADRIQGILADHLEGRTPAYKTEHRLRHRDGHWVWVLDAGRVYTRDAQGNPLKAAGIHLDISRAKKVEADLNAAVEETRAANEKLSRALSEVRTLRGIIPICASCKKIRDDDGFWIDVENYISTRIEGDFSHGICPDCSRTLYPDLHEQPPDTDPES